jgi:hypothetical protein
MRIQQTAISVADPDAEYPELSGHPDPYYYIKKVSTIKKGSKNVRLRSGSVIRICGSTDPDPKEKVTDPQY